MPKSKLEKLVQSYQQRAFDEDIQMIQQFEGVDNIASQIGSNTYSGLTGQDNKQRIKQYGHNRKKEVEREGFWNMWLGALDDLMLKILIVAALVSMIISIIFEKENKSIAWIEGAAILMAVFIVSGVTAWNDYKKEEQFIELTKFSDKQNVLTVMRKGEEKEISIEGLLVGDLVKIKAGMSIPVDGILV